MSFKNFTRKDLSKKLHLNLGLSKNYLSKVVDNFVESIVSELIKFNEVKISSFGTFRVANKKERIGRNPKTKKETIITARKIVKFKPSLIVKKKLNY